MESLRVKVAMAVPWGVGESVPEGLVLPVGTGSRSGSWCVSRGRRLGSPSACRCR